MRLKAMGILLATAPKDGKLLYHLTSVDNLDNIFKYGLQPRAQLALFKDVADQEIITHRHLHGLDNFVPFHFFNNNPFDGIVQINHPDIDFAFITLRREFARNFDFKVITQHPLTLTPLVIHDYEAGINAIDWDLMATRDYHIKQCKDVCMAECLSPYPLQADWFLSIVVKSEEVKTHVISIANQNFGLTIPFHINVEERWFVR